MKISCEFGRRREDPLAVLALALAEQLLPPFADEVQTGLETRKQFDVLPTRVQKTSGDGVVKSVVGRCRRTKAVSALFCGALQHRTDIQASDRKRKETDRSKYRIASPDVARQVECDQGLVLGKVVQGSMLRVCYGHDTGACLFCTEPSNQLCFQDVEGNRSLKRRAGFRDDHDGEAVARKPVQQLSELP